MNSLKNRHKSKRTIPINLKRIFNYYKSSSPSFSNTIEAYINLSNIYIDRIIYSRKKTGNFFQIIIKIIYLEKI